MTGISKQIMSFARYCCGWQIDSYGAIALINKYFKEGE